MRELNTLERAFHVQKKINLNLCKRKICSALVYQRKLEQLALLAEKRTLDTFLNIIFTPVCLFHDVYGIVYVKYETDTVA